MEDFQSLGRAGEGAHGFVFKALDKKNGNIVALKKISFNPNFGIPKNVLREICALRALKSPHIMELFDIRSASSGVILVMEYLPCSLADILHTIGISLNLPQVKTFMKMFLMGLDYLHSNNIMHRDLKPANLLIAENGILKIGDFGLARIYKKSGIRTYSHQVATRWYRAPELLYGSRIYTPAIDMWAAGCILGEMLNRQPLFPGETDIEQLAIVLSTLGSPTEESWPGLQNLPDYNKIAFSPTAPKNWKEILPSADDCSVRLIQNMLKYDDSKRPRAAEALLYPFFFKRPLPCALEDLPDLNEIKSDINYHIESFDDILEKLGDV